MYILYYDGNDGKKRSRVEAVLSSFSIPFKMIESAQGEETIASLLASNAQPSCTKTRNLPDFDLLIFYNVEDDLISRISADLREHHAHVERKCVVTATNQSWKLADLLFEIMEEHAYYGSYNQCYTLIKEVGTLTESDYTKTSWSAYQDAFMKGCLLLQEQQPSKTALDEAIREITLAKQQLRQK